MHLDDHTVPKLHTEKRVLLAIVGSTVFVGSLLSGMSATAQPPPSVPPSPSFEVASIKAKRSSVPMNRFLVGRGGSFTATSCSVRLLIEYAFQVKRYQVSSGPAWVGSDGFDIAARGEGDPEIRYMPGMVQRLLEDRFQLKYHWETKEAQVIIWS